MDDGWDQIDTVRLLLASVVAVGHGVGILAHPFGYASEAFNDALSTASIVAVLVFFLISGLVIGRSLFRLCESGGLIFVAFMRRRVLRIYPPLLFSVVLCIALAGILQAAGMDRYSGTAEPVRASFSYLQGLRDVIVAMMTFGFRGGLTASSNGPLWSLALEMQAYVFAGLAAQIWAARSWWGKTLSATLLITVLRWRDTSDLDPYHVACFGLFAAGMVASLAPIKFPAVLPVVPVDFSYSLYILHFPLMLFIFFVWCQQTPSAAMAWTLVAASLAVSVAMSIGSGLTLERVRYLFRKPRATLYSEPA